MIEFARSEQEVLGRTDERVEQVRTTSTTLKLTGPAGQVVADRPVELELVRHEFLFGCNFFSWQQLETPERNAEYEQRFLELFNYATLPFYWRGYEPEPGKPNHPYMDQLVDWCLAHGRRLKGHPLLWACLEGAHGTPRWYDGVPTQEMMRARVEDCVRRYRGRIQAWEVVNEPAHHPWLPVDGPYRWARDADPSAELILNDFQVLNWGYPPFYELLTRAIERGVPFDGIGIQAHEPRTDWFHLDGAWNTLLYYGQLGKSLHITEFTPPTTGAPITGPHKGEGVWDEEAQALCVEQFYRLFFAHPAVKAITFWDLGGKHVWQGEGGLLRPDFSPRPSYEVLRKLIRGQWHTRIAARTDGQGQVSFRGFRGQYELRMDGRPAGCFTLANQPRIEHNLN